MSRKCVMIGDIQESRTLDDWAHIFESLGTTLTLVNEQYSGEVLISFRPTVGDEFQGALMEPAGAYAVYVSMRSRLPVRIYCGVGVGEIEKPLGTDIGMRGTAFYRARAALEECKKRGRNLIIRSSDRTNQRDKTINTLLYLIQVLERSWTKRQHEVLTYYRQNRGDTYEQLGLHFGISKQAVSQILKAGDSDAISEAETVVNELLVCISEYRDQGEA